MSIRRFWQLVVAVVSVAVIPQIHALTFPGLVGYWPGDDDATDATGNSNGILVNETSFAAGKAEQAFQFDGANDQMRVPDVSALDVTDLTVAFWFKPTVNAIPIDENLVGKNGFTSGNWGFAVDTTGLLQRQVKFRAVGSASPIIGGTIAADAAGYMNQFFHVAGTVVSGGQMKLFINGYEYSSTAFAGTLVANNLDIYLSGNAALNSYFGGLIDDLQIYNRALTDSEIFALSQVPEPTVTSLLLGAGLVMFCRWRR